MLALDPSRRFDGTRRKPRKSDADDDEAEAARPRSEFAPRHRLAGDRRSPGVEVHPELSNEHSIKALQKIFHHIRRVQRTPVVWHHSRATGLDKKNNKEGFSAMDIFTACAEWEYCGSRLSFGEDLRT